MDVWQHDETFFDEEPRGLEGGNRVGKQVFWVGDHFQLQPVGAGQLAGESGREHRFIDSFTAGGIRQDRITGPVEVVHQVRVAWLIKGEPTYGNGHDLRARGVDGVPHLLHAAVLAGADDEPGAEGPAGDD